MLTAFYDYIIKLLKFPGHKGFRKSRPGNKSKDVPLEGGPGNDMACAFIFKKRPAKYNFVLLEHMIMRMIFENSKLNYRIKQQLLLNQNQRNYDCIITEYWPGGDPQDIKERMFYFDITEVF